MESSVRMSFPNNNSTFSGLPTNYRLKVQMMKSSLSSPFSSSSSCKKSSITFYLIILFLIIYLAIFYEEELTYLFKQSIPKSQELEISERPQEPISPPQGLKPVSERQQQLTISPQGLKNNFELVWC